MVSTLDYGLSDLGSGPGQEHCAVFLGKTLYLIIIIITYILLDVLLCSIAEYFYELCRILASP